MTKKKKYIYINLKNTREDKDLKQKDIAKLIHVLRVHTLTMRITKEKCPSILGNYFLNF